MKLLILMTNMLMLRVHHAIGTQNTLLQMEMKIVAEMKEIVAETKEMSS